MRTLISAVAVSLLAAGNYALAQTTDPDIRGPARRAAGAAAEALGAPGVEDRVERRQMRREARRGDWRMRFYNGEWWYYTPENNWVYYRDNRWMPYDRGTFRALPQRYTTGYRGTYTSRADRPDRGAFGKAGPPMLTIGIYDDSFEPQTINIPAGATVRWINHGSEEHSVTADNESWDSGDLGTDETYSARFRQPGSYPYHCDHHKQMTGTIIVGEAQASDPPSRPGVDVDVNRGEGVDVDINRQPGAEVDINRPKGANREADRQPAAEVDVNRRGVDVDVKRPAPKPQQPNPAPAPSEAAPQ